jgi:UV DNA damage endonuclease
MTNYGLVCVTFCDLCRFRTITRTRYLQLSKSNRTKALRAVYWDNLHRLHRTLSFCARNDIHLYRMSSSLFPMSDETMGREMLRSMSANLSSIGRRAQRLNIRIVVHPDQFVVLNSENPKVARTSVRILEKHALAMDLMGLPRSPWAAMTIHGGKSGRAEALVAQIANLPESVRFRLVLENDEYAYSASEILDICRRAHVPMVFDNHHHVIHEKLASHEDVSVARFVRASRSTWPNRSWQMVHLSNGITGVHDRHHSEFIDVLPSAYRNVRWIEVEATGKECAIARLRAR